MSREYDIFYDAAGEGSWAEFRGFSASIVAATTCTASPQSYGIGFNGTTADTGSWSGNSQSIPEGTVVVLRDMVATDGVYVAAYMEVTKSYDRPDPTIEMRPLCSKGDTLAPSMNTVVGHEFATRSQILTHGSGYNSGYYTGSTAPAEVEYTGIGEQAWAEASRLVIDLTEAPEETYDYVVFGCGWLNATIDHPAASGPNLDTGGTQTVVKARMRICLPDDIYADAGVNTDNDIYTENIVTITKASTKQADLSTAFAYGYELDGGECYNAQVGGIVSLKGGQRYDISLQFCCLGNCPTVSSGVLGIGQQN
jgi:hypothetical protein